MVWRTFTRWYNPYLPNNNNNNNNNNSGNNSAATAYAQPVGADATRHVPVPPPANNGAPPPPPSPIVTDVARQNSGIQPQANQTIVSLLIDHKGASLDHNNEKEHHCKASTSRPTLPTTIDAATSKDDNNIEILDSKEIDNKQSNNHDNDDGENDKDGSNQQQFGIPATIGTSTSQPSDGKTTRTWKRTCTRRYNPYLPNKYSAALANLNGIAPTSQPKDWKRTCTRRYNPYLPHNYSNVPRPIVTVAVVGDCDSHEFETPLRANRTIVHPADSNSTAPNGIALEKSTAEGNATKTCPTKNDIEIMSSGINKENDDNNNRKRSADWTTPIHQNDSTTATHTTNNSTSSASAYQQKEQSHSPNNYEPMIIYNDTDSDEEDYRSSDNDNELNDAVVEAAINEKQSNLGVPEPVVAVVQNQGVPANKHARLDETANKDSMPPPFVDDNKVTVGNTEATADKSEAAAGKKEATADNDDDATAGKHKVPDCDKLVEKLDGSEMTPPPSKLLPSPQAHPDDEVEPEAATRKVSLASHPDKKTETQDKKKGGPPAAVHAVPLVLLEAEDNSIKAMTQDYFDSVADKVGKTALPKVKLGYYGPPCRGILHAARKKMTKKNSWSTVVKSWEQLNADDWVVAGQYLWKHAPHLSNYEKPVLSLLILAACTPTLDVADKKKVHVHVLWITARRLFGNLCDFLPELGYVEGTNMTSELAAPYAKITKTAWRKMGNMIPFGEEGSKTCLPDAVTAIAHNSLGFKLDNNGNIVKLGKAEVKPVSVAEETALKTAIRNKLNNVHCNIRQTELLLSDNRADMAEIKLNVNQQIKGNIHSILHNLTGGNFVIVVTSGGKFRHAVVLEAGEEESRLYDNTMRGSVYVIKKENCRRPEPTIEAFKQMFGYLGKTVIVEGLYAIFDESTRDNIDDFILNDPKCFNDFSGRASREKAKAEYLKAKADAKKAKKKEKKRATKQLGENLPAKKPRVFK